MHCFAQNIWKARCVEQWNVPATAASCAWRALHIDLVHCLSLVDGTADGCGGCYDNVLAIVDVLDAYRTLAEMTRACFGRLGQLLESDEAREAVKVVDWRIMDHALWALKAYPDDVDLLLVRRALHFILLQYLGSNRGRQAGRQALENRWCRVFLTSFSCVPACASLVGGVCSTRQKCC